MFLFLGGYGRFLPLSGGGGSQEFGDDGGFGGFGGLYIIINNLHKNNFAN